MFNRESFNSGLDLESERNALSDVCQIINTSIGQRDHDDPLHPLKLLQYSPGQMYALRLMLSNLDPSNLKPTRTDHPYFRQGYGVQASIGSLGFFPAPENAFYVQGMINDRALMTYQFILPSHPELFIFLDRDIKKPVNVDEFMRSAFPYPPLSPHIARGYRAIKKVPCKMTPKRMIVDYILHQRVNDHIVTVEFPRLPLPFNMAAYGLCGFGTGWQMWGQFQTLERVHKPNPPPPPNMNLGGLQSI